MNNVEKILQNSENAIDFASGYLDYLSWPVLKADTMQMDGFIHELEARKSNKTILRKVKQTDEPNAR